MAKHLHWWLSQTTAHLTDEQILGNIEGTPPAPLPARAARHLSSCWKCRARMYQLQETIFKVVEYQQKLLDPFLPPPPNGEERLIARLEQQLDSGKEPWFVRIGVHIPSFGILPINLASASAVLALFVIGALLTFWYRASSPVSAHELLLKAAGSESSLQARDAGVVRQRIRIHTPTETVDRTVYFDVQKRRHAKPVKLSSEAEKLSSALGGAGVSWDDPLSAGSFKDWHDHQVIQKDEVQGTENGLLSLTTSVASGAVASETLTVRTSDFHSVARSIQFRNQGTIEIAELDYAVLGWNADSESAFEPVQLTMAAPAPPAALPVLSTVPTREEMDEAELQARLALSRIDADSTEPLEFTRSEAEIQIKGVVETNERKNELLTQLRPLPRVNASIFSVEELNAHSYLQRPGSITTRDYSAAGGPSPLSLFLDQRSGSQSDASLASQNLLDAALGIQRESRVLTELTQRFDSTTHQSEAARRALNALLTHHLNRLDNALNTEEEVVGSLVPRGSLPDTPGTAAAAGSQTLATAAARNRTLCSELISGSESSPRSAAAIIIDILGSIEEVRRTARDARTQTVSSPIQELSRER